MAQLNKIPEHLISGRELLEFSASVATPMAPYAYRIEGTSYGNKWGVSMTRSAAKMLALAILEAL